VTLDLLLGRQRNDARARSAAASLWRPARRPPAAALHEAAADRGREDQLDALVGMLTERLLAEFPSWDQARLSEALAGLEWPPPPIPDHVPASWI